VRRAFAAFLPVWKAMGRIFASTPPPRAPASHKVPTPMDHSRRPAAQHPPPPETAVASRMTPLAAQVEALLLVAGDTATVEALAHALTVSKDAVEEGLDALDQHYAATGHGARLQRLGARVQLATAPEHAGVVARFLGVPERTRLSPAALETLAIVAYRQPVTRPEIESIRGVNCDHVMRSLLDQGLIEERGRADTPGRPAVYGTTMTFLEALGLRTLDDLPPLDER
jgi:segregation and condensation protein B